MDEIFMVAFTEELAELYELIGLEKEASAEPEGEERLHFMDVLQKIASK